MRELTDDMVLDHCAPPPTRNPSHTVTIPGRHVADVARHPDGRLAVITWSSPEIDPGLLNPALHVVETDGTVIDLGATSVDAGNPVWWGDEVVYLADGTVADRGPHATLLARNPAYARLVNAYEQAREAVEAGDPA